MATIYDVAKSAGVSPKTVSRVLNGDAPVNAKTREAVTKAIDLPGYGQLEVPQVFKHQGQWYCLFCTADEHFSQAQAKAIPGGPVTGNHYLIGDGPRGPWKIAPGAFLDGAQPCLRYAARILQTDDGLVILGFSHTRSDGTFGGVVMDPAPVVQHDNGLLKVERPSLAAE